MAQLVAQACFRPPATAVHVPWNDQARSRLCCMIHIDQHPTEEKPTMSQNKTASRKDDSKLRGKEARPAIKNDAAKLTDSSVAPQKAKDSDKKAAGNAPAAGKAEGKKLAGNAGKSSAAR